ncbi:NlpC/P60 family protein [Martelella radicis]|uniref:NlpC/P60 family putative phage cell wall peptidase n=1 Tax=Martelella radicis TaxID=1397476 RepID=A0A7W6P8U6_9HYPH|nr:NlpC/P60 family protein [Martelella radicis]MBB4121597.1 NlpC/P60 family putative phage cell wall peptidase [Martelella radicis]
MNTMGARAVAVAETWIGTPYRHQAARRGVGCDCLGLIRGVWDALYGELPGADIDYAPDWAERSGQERLLDAAMLFCGEPLAQNEMAPGDILLFRWRPQFAAKHAGILSGPDQFIHAYEQAGVTRSSLVPGWRRRIAGVFRFPDDKPVLLQAG